MKKIYFLILILACFLSLARAEKVVTVNSDYGQSGLWVGYNFPATGSSYTYGVNITNNSDIFITVEFESFLGYYYVSDNSTATGYYLFVVNFWDWGEVVLEGVPPGAYVVSVSGAATSDEGLVVYVN